MPLLATPLLYSVAQLSCSRGFQSQFQQTCLLPQYTSVWNSRDRLSEDFHAQIQLSTAKCRSFIWFEREERFFTYLRSLNSIQLFLVSITDGAESYSFFFCNFGFNHASRVNQCHPPSRKSLFVIRLRLPQACDHLDLIL